MKTERVYCVDYHGDNTPVNSSSTPGSTFNLSIRVQSKTIKALTDMAQVLVLTIVAVDGCDVRHAAVISLVVLQGALAQW